MRLGIDFGTTRAVVASADRGNYPVVTFETDGGQGCEWFPSLVAVRGDEVRSGHAAEAVLGDPEWQPLRSLKRLLGASGPRDRALGLPVSDLATRYLHGLRAALLESSNLGAAPGEPLEVAISIPANAPANQRLLTADAFARAGFLVRRILDEPSAAGLEYAWRRPSDAQVKKRHVAVYDLGGGTFDASVIAMSDALHEVLTTDGVGRLGGDDFDEALLALACSAAGREQPEAGPERQRMLELCRQEKERITASTRRLAPDLFTDGGGPRIAIEAYEAALRPLIDRSLAALDAALARVAERAGREVERHTVVYQVGGASQLPAVGRALRERFGRRVWRSPYPHASVAIGLAIAAEEERSPRIAGSLTRHFGVWRERDAGHGAVFDPIFEKDQALPSPGAAASLTRVRRYRAHHNVGHFRYVECSRLLAGAPAGDVTPWGEVRSPLVAALADRPLDEVAVERLSSEGDVVEECYRVDANGVIEVEIRNLTAGYARTFSPSPAPQR
ncbi:MAG: Hsp70 family protein [Myxococcales bacterium]|nr:Hsp70 family protein [Myxococcales bacterium]